MSDYSIYHQEFMSELQNKIPQRSVLVNTITDILAIDKDAVYRRLRGEVVFSFAEMANIVRNLGISLDNLVRIKNAQTRPTRVIFIKQVNPTEIDYELFEEHVNMLKSIKDEPDTKIMEAGVIFSQYLYQDYEYITRFFLYRWNYSGHFGNAAPFHELIIPERLRTLQKESSLYAKYIKSSLYILDSMIFQRLVLNIKYLARIHFIKAEDVSLIKDDLISFIDDLEKLAIEGKYEETGNEVSIFISDINLDTSYSCLKSKNIQLTLFRVFILNFVVSFDEEVYNEVCAWIRSMERMSTLISVSGEKIRAAFFDAQRKIVDSLNETPYKQYIQVHEYAEDSI